jgi:hypothetical protein
LSISCQKVVKKVAKKLSKSCYKVFQKVGKKLLKILKWVGEEGGGEEGDL